MIFSKKKKLKKMLIKRGLLTEQIPLDNNKRIAQWHEKDGVKKWYQARESMVCYL